MRKINQFAKIFNNKLGKVSDKWSSYLAVYERVLSDYRDDNISLLEVGIQNGGSLEVYDEYFKNAKIIVGCDINSDCSKLNYLSRKINIVVGSCLEDSSYNKIISLSQRYDLIIDDGSHTSSDIIATFLRYFPSVNSGGLYIIEDLHCSYWQEWEGGLYYPKSSMSFLKQLVDLLNFEHWGVAQTKAEFLAKRYPEYKSWISDAFLGEILSVEFYNSICVIRKCSNENKASLGPRIVVGIDSIVSSDALAVNGSVSQCLDQSKNIWSMPSYQSSTIEDFEKVLSVGRYQIGKFGLCPCGSGDQTRLCCGFINEE